MPLPPRAKPARRRRRTDDDNHEPEDLKPEGPDVDAERDPLDPMQTLVPDGTYTLAYLRTDRFSWHKVSKYAVTFEIMDPKEFAGRRLLRFYTDLSRKKRVARSSSLARDFEAITNLLAPRKHFNPSYFLAGTQVLAAVSTVTSRPGPGGLEERPPGARYSKVDHLIQVVAGTPLCIRHRSGSGSR